MKKEKFDSNGLLFAIGKINKSYILSLTKGFEQTGFCSVCLGANVPNQDVRPRGSWCCGSWCDDLLPIWRICKRFKVDKNKVEELAEKIRPSKNKDPRKMKKGEIIVRSHS